MSDDSPNPPSVRAVSYVLLYHQRTFFSRLPTFTSCTNPTIGHQSYNTLFHFYNSHHNFIHRAQQFSAKCTPFVFSVFS